MQPTVIDLPVINLGAACRHTEAARARLETALRSFEKAAKAARAAGEPGLEQVLLRARGSMDLALSDVQRALRCGRRILEETK